MSNPEKIEGKYIAFRDVIINHFTNKEKAATTFYLSLLLTVLIMGIVFSYPCPSDFQQQILHVVMAMSLSGYSSAFSNRINLGNSTKLGIPIVIFVLVLATNLSTSLIRDDCVQSLQLTGTVWLGNYPLSGAEIESPELNEEDKTNNLGKYNLPFDNQFLKQPIKLIVRYNGIKKQKFIEALDPSEPFDIHLSDTITDLTEALIENTVKAHLLTKSENRKAEVQSLIQSENGKEVSWSFIQQRIAIWQKLQGGETKDVRFSNGFWKLHTQKAIIAAGIQERSFRPGSKWGIKQPQVIVLGWQHDIEAKQRQNTVRLDFLLIDQAPIEISILGNIREESYARKRVRIKHVQPIEIQRFTLEYSSNTGWKKRNKVQLQGSLPVEEYLLEFRDNSWQVVDSIYPSTT